MNETETRINLINPKLIESEWFYPNLPHEYPIKTGRKLVGNLRASTLEADYLLKFKNTHLAFIEAKHEALSPTEGLEQVKNYAELLKLNIAYSTNGHRIYEFDMLAGKGQYNMLKAFQRFKLFMNAFSETKIALFKNYYQFLYSILKVNRNVITEKLPFVKQWKPLPMVKNEFY